MLHFVFSGRYGELLWGCEVTIKFIYIQVRLVKCVNNQRFLAWIDIVMAVFSHDAVAIIVL